VIVFFVVSFVLLLVVILRGYLFTDRDRERLRAWLKPDAEDDAQSICARGKTHHP
jgi:hypothetical protein